jgi:hypothetical protein
MFSMLPLRMAVPQETNQVGSSGTRRGKQTQQEQPQFGQQQGRFLR